MFNNYHYFIALAEEENISRAAEKLFISHQCLSKYLKNLEAEYNLSFFDRTPSLRLTPAGQAMLETLRQVDFLEQNLNSQLDDIRFSKKGKIRLGVTEGRSRIVIPDVIAQFRKMYPEVVLEVKYADSVHLSDLVLKNELDLALMNRNDFNHSQLSFRVLLKEQLYLVISEPLLRQYFPKAWPDCLGSFKKGVDLAKFTEVPFIMLQKGLSSRDCIESYQRARGIHLNCTMELLQPDLCYMMTARDYAASFCWTMYLSQIRQINSDPLLSHLYAFPIRGLRETNEVVLITLLGKKLPGYGRDLVRLLETDCQAFTNPGIMDL
ncbi:MAG TPA: hypothetical protein DCG70_08470 [Lachnoclostridium sp.]|nr:hypothetical protein [Lachnoclostridium sp.]